MANARLEIIIDGDSADAQEALEGVKKAVDGVGDAAEKNKEKTGGFFGSINDIVAGNLISGAIEGIAGSIAAIGGAMIDIGTQASDARTILQGLASDVDMQSLLSDASLLSARYGIDTAESVAAAKTLMTEFGVSGDEAMTMIISGFESGMNTSGDFLDTIGEYSNLFAANGADAVEMFSLIQSGMAGGALGTDKAADAFKEFGIRIREVPDELFGPEGTLVGTLKMSEDEVSTLYKGMQDGTISVADAFNDLMPRLAAIENPIYRNTVGTQLFGTAWEDLGPTIAGSLDMAGQSYEEMEAQSNTARTTIASLGEIGPLLMGQLAVAFLPVHDAFVVFINDILQGTSTFTPFITWIQANAIPVIAALGAGLVVFAGLVMSTMVPALTAQATAAWAAMAPFLPFIAIAAGVAAVVFLLVDNWGAMTEAFNAAGGGLAGLGAAFGVLGQVIMDWLGSILGPLGENIAMMATQFWVWVEDTWPKLVAALGDWWTNFTGWLGEKIAALPAEVAKLAAAFGGWVGGLWTTMVTGLGEWWDDLTAWLATLPAQLATKAGEIGTAIIDGIKDGISGAAGSLMRAATGVVGDAVDAVKSWLGISSPSALFRDEVGAMMGAGMVEGLMGSAGMVRSASYAVASGGLSGAQVGATDAQSVIYNYNYSPVYSSVPSQPSADFALMQSLARSF